MDRRCNVCGSHEYISWYQPPQSPGPVVQCNSCGFVYVTPIQKDKALIQEGPVLGERSPDLLTSSDLSQIDGSWEEPIINGYIQELQPKQANAREALSHLDKLTARGKILDYGCFCGVFLSVAAQQGWDAYGIEPLVMPSIYARGKYNLQIVTDTLHDNTYPQDFFDAVTGLQVFEHIVEARQELQKIYHILKPGGLVLIEVPNIETIWIKILKGKHRHFVQDHVNFFSGKTLSHFVESVGFKTEEVYYPVRVLSYKHLAWWVSKLMGQRVGGVVNRLVDSLGLSDKNVNLSVGDIVCVIARKK